MTEAAAFRATYHHMRPIPGRGIAQVILEVPAEEAHLVSNVLGGIMSPPGQAVWVAVARLNTERGTAPDAEKYIQSFQTERQVVPNRQVEASHSPEDNKLPAPAPERPARAEVAPEKRLTQQAGIACADPMFRQFIAEWCCSIDTSEDATARTVRNVCGVESRTEIIPGSDAAAKWDVLYSKFVAWRDVPELVP